MTITLNHTLIHVHSAVATAAFYSEILGLPAAKKLAHFTIVQIGETSLDLLETDEPIASRHFAFLVSDTEFDDIFGQITVRELTFWADPFHKEPNQINHWDDGRGLYFDDPNGHLLEIITRPYGSGGLSARHANPLLTR